MYTIREAKKLITAENKAYVTSDNSIYCIPRADDIKALVKHCKENDLSLLDVEEDKEIVSKKVSKKEDATANG